MNKEIAIRIAHSRDYDVVADVMYDAVRHGRSAYSEKQRRAWVPTRRTGPEWSERLEGQTVFVAENSGDTVGFMSLADGGYIDFAYIRPAHQGAGLFRKLYQCVEQAAKDTGLSRLWVHASVTARPAFSAIGFKVVQRETVEIRDESFERFEMEKLI